MEGAKGRMMCEWRAAWFLKMALDLQFRIYLNAACKISEQYPLNKQAIEPMNFIT